MTHSEASRCNVARYPLDRIDAQALVAASMLHAPHVASTDLAYRGLDAAQKAVLVLGAFDGLHEGHRQLVASAHADARDRGVACVAVTFDPDPSVLLHPTSPQPQLLEVIDRVRGLRSLGIDHVVTLPFDGQLASLTPEEFVRTILCAITRPVAIHVGSNFRFGAHGAGDVQLLRQLGASMGFEVQECPLVRVGSERVSSTRIRTLLAQPARLAEANGLLCRCHFVRGRVEHGRGEGTSFGFPTANVRCSPLVCMPSQGVYGGYVCVADVAWPAAINVGAPPSFSGPDDLMLEANLIGFSGDLYDAAACVVFVEWLRPSRRFSSLDELERVVLGNIAWVRDNLGEGEVSMA